MPVVKNINSSFIYLATIDCSDEFFNWMSLERLHLAYPIYEGSFEVFLDYSNPNSPKVINPETFNWSWFDKKQGSLEEIAFFKQNYVSTSIHYYNDIDRNPENYLLCGVPLWYQAPQIPICPKTGNVMRFVTTINSDKNIRVSNKSNIPELPFTSNYLNFGDYGNLFVFYEPTSRVVHLNFQF